MKRLCGYDVEPLRVDIMAAIEHSKLVYIATIIIICMHPTILHLPYLVTYTVLHMCITCFQADTGV